VGTRKFFAGDTVVVTGDDYQKHNGHVAQVTGTRIIRGPGPVQRTNYYVRCECGKALLPAPHQLSGPVGVSDKNDYTKLYESRVRHLFKTVGVLYKEDSPTEEQLEQLMGVLDARYQDVVQRRFGLIEGPQTLQGIGDSMGLTKQFIKQIEERALRKLAR